MRREEDLMVATTNRLRPSGVTQMADVLRILYTSNSTASEGAGAGRAPIGSLALLWLLVVLPACSGIAVMDGHGPPLTCRDAPMTLWSNRYPDGFTFDDVVPMGGGEYWLVRSTKTSSNIPVLTRANRYGEVLAEHHYASDNGQVLTLDSVDRAEDGSLVLAGSVYEGQQAPAAVWFGLAKSNGQLTSNKVFIPESGLRLRLAAVAHPGGGSLFSYAMWLGDPLDESNYLVLHRLDSSGNEVWKHSYPVTTTGWGSPNQTVFAPNGDVFWLTTGKNSMQEDTIRLVRISTSGKVVWDNSYEADRARPKDLALLPNGDLVVVSDSDMLPLLLRISGDGLELRRKIIGGYYYGSLRELTALPDGTLMLVGNASRQPSDLVYHPLWLLHLDQDFQVRWEHLSDSHSSAEALVTTERGFVVSGSYGILNDGAWFAEAVMCPR